jgi:tetratricopeptide (TPR) repeat protein
MSLLAATQIPKPADEQAFERASIVLWRCILIDPNVHRHGRRGQSQNGVDLVGIRNGDPAHLVGIQCKLKGVGHKLTEKEVRDEVEKTATFPELREYFIITTAPDDVELQRLASELTVDLAANGRPLLIYVWGWNTLEERISEHAEARKAFDPDYGPFSETILNKVEENATLAAEIKDNIGAGFSQLTARLASVEAVLRSSPGDATVAANALEVHLDAEIDELRDLAAGGKPHTALPILERLLARVVGTASGRILFRVKANIGSCHFALGEDEMAAQLFSDAYDHAPTEPKAIANKALSLLLQGHWQQLLTFGAKALRDDPTNDGLAGYLVQAARFDEAIDEPLDLLPEQVKSSAAVAVARVDFLRHRGRMPEWWKAAHAAVAAHPDDRNAQQFSAESNLDEILRDRQFQRTGRFQPGERARILDAAHLLVTHWNRERSGEGIVRPERVAVCSNLIVAFHALRDLPKAIEIARQGLAVAPDDVVLASRAAMVAIDGRDEALVREVLPRLPAGPDTTALKFRFHAQRGEWAEVAELCRTNAADIPEVERVMVTTVGQLAEIKLEPSEDAEARLTAIVRDVADDPRASIVAADFAMRLGHDKIGERAYQNAVRKIDVDSHIARRLMVAMYAAKRADWKSVADLLDGHVDEEYDSEELRMLATAMVNDSPIRRRAIHFFERLPAAINGLQFYLYVVGLLHFNRGALKEAETSLRRAVEAKPDLTNYLALSRHCAVWTSRKRSRQSCDR